MSSSLMPSVACSTHTMPEPGIYLWRSPAGRRYLVDHTGTTAPSHTPPDHESCAPCCDLPGVEFWSTRADRRQPNAV